MRCNKFRMAQKELDLLNGGSPLHTFTFTTWTICQPSVSILLLFNEQLQLTGMDKVCHTISISRVLETFQKLESKPR